MQTNPGIAMFGSPRQTSVMCASCSAVVYELKPYEGVYPLRSAMRAMGNTSRVKGVCRCGHKYEFPVTRP
jgi:hypothetical protein